MDTDKTDYTSLVEWITKGKNKQSRPIANNTIARLDNNRVIVSLHNTDIVFITQDTITLYTGGWHTLTTKERLNSFIPPPFVLYQESGQWYLRKGYQSTDKWLFAEGITINLSDNSVSNAGSLQDEKHNQMRRKQINTFADNYIKKLFAGKVSKPDNGDCFYCHMRTVGDNKPLGDSVEDTDHLLSHFREKYYVPSMLINAIDVFTVSQAAKWVLGALWFTEDKEEKNSTLSAFGDIAEDQLKKSLKRYLYRAFGLPS